MAVPDRLHESSQQNLITLLCLDDEYGQLVAKLIDPSTFDGEYKEVAVRACAYWQEHKRAPGRAHVQDLVADIMADSANRRASGMRRVIMNMLQLGEEINAQYVMNQLRLFARLQGLKDAILAAAELMNAPNATTIEEVENVLGNILRADNPGFDRGTKLNDDLRPFIDYLQTSNSEFVTGLTPLDDRGIVPARGAIMLLIAGKGRGKTWFLTNAGKNALMLHHKVLHVSLEINEPEQRMRYYQSLFGVARRTPDAGIDVTDLEVGERGQVVGFADSTVRPEFDFQSQSLQDELEVRVDLMGGRNDNLIIKRFPNRTLTVDGLSGYLDMLEQVDRFVPDILLLDYARLMKLPTSNAKDYRIGVGHNMEKLRALAVERNLALVTADQLNRTGHDAKQARSSHIGEDWSQVHTADVVLTHSATDAEKRRGLCRIYVDHARTEADKFGIIVSQNFAIGQFALQSALLPANYYDDIMPGAAHDDDVNYDDTGIQDAG
jgi:hypothetical protein